MAPALASDGGMPGLDSKTAVGWNGIVAWQASERSSTRSLKWCVSAPPGQVTSKVWSVSLALAMVNVPATMGAVVVVVGGTMVTEKSCVELNAPLPQGCAMLSSILNVADVSGNDLRSSGGSKITWPPALLTQMSSLSR